MKKTTKPKKRQGTKPRGTMPAREQQRANLRAALRDERKVLALARELRRTMNRADNALFELLDVLAKQCRVELVAPGHDRPSSSPPSFNRRADDKLRMAKMEPAAAGAASGE